MMIAKSRVEAELNQPSILLEVRITVICSLSSQQSVDIPTKQSPSVVELQVTQLLIAITVPHLSFLSDDY